MTPSRSAGTALAYPPRPPQRPSQIADTAIAHQSVSPSGSDPVLRDARANIASKCANAARAGAPPAAAALNGLHSAVSVQTPPPGSALSHPVHAPGPGRSWAIGTAWPFPLDPHPLPTRPAPSTSPAEDSLASVVNEEPAASLLHLPTPRPARPPASVAVPQAEGHLPGPGAPTWSWTPAFLLTDLGA